MLRRTTKDENDDENDDERDDDESDDREKVEIATVLLHAQTPVTKWTSSEQVSSLDRRYAASERELRVMNGRRTDWHPIPLSCTLALDIVGSGRGM